MTEALFYFPITINNIIFKDNTQVTTLNRFPVDDNAPLLEACGPKIVNGTTVSGFALALAGVNDIGELTGWSPGAESLCWGGAVSTAAICVKLKALSARIMNLPVILTLLKRAIEPISRVPLNKSSAALPVWPVLVSKCFRPARA